MPSSFKKIEFASRKNLLPVFFCLLSMFITLVSNALPGPVSSRVATDAYMIEKNKHAGQASATGNQLIAIKYAIKKEITDATTGSTFASTVIPQTTTATSINFNQLFPIDIINFIVVQKGETLLLNWSTVNELNDGSFSIEYSRNDGPFTSVGKLQSMGKTLSIQNNYSFRYTGFAAGVSNFRLILTDVNGLVKRSETVVIRIKEDGSIALFPNPASQQVTLQFRNGWTGKPAVIQLVKQTGELLYQKKVTALQWSENTDVSQLASGNYIIQVMCNGEVITKAVKVQHD